jgi:hypothetical protein
MAPITLEGIFARTIAAWGVDKLAVERILERAVAQFPDLEQRAVFVREQLASIVPGSEFIANAIAGFASDWATRSAAIDPDAWGGA